VLKHLHGTTATRGVRPENESGRVGAVAFCKEDLMFASWSKTRTAMLSAGAAAALALVASPSARALEGIQGRHAIFYPSLELVYQHDDNYFLTPDNETSADTFIAHAHFALEVPGSRQFLRLEYAPQYRNVSVNNGPNPDLDDVQHFWNLQARLKGSSIFSVDIDHDFTLGQLEVYELDDNREFNKGAGEPFWANHVDVGFNWEGSRQGATVGLTRNDSQFDDLDEAPTWFELNEMRYRGEYYYKFTPLTDFRVGIAHRDSGQDFTESYSATTGVTELDSTRTDVYIGFNGELGRTTTGTARVGFASLDYDDSPVGDASDWDGLVLSADVTKSFSRYSKLIFGVDRDVNFSAFATTDNELNTYYVSNRAAVTFSQQPQGGRLGWSVKGGFQRNGYDVRSDADGTGDAQEREDDITHLRAEVGYHPLEHLSFRVNYRYEERDSNFRTFDYTDNLWIFQVQFGF
jgi:hypothetical protein